MTQAQTLAERLALLACRTDNHKIRSPFSSQTGNFDYTLQAALVVELIERGRVAVVSKRGPFGGEKFTLEQSGFEPTGNAPLDSLLARVADPKNTRKSLQNWLMYSSTRQTIIEDLAERGIVTVHHEGSGLLAKTRVRPADPATHDAIRDEFEDVFLRDREPSRPDLLTAALLASGETWEYVEPLEGTPGMAHFFERLIELSNRYGPKWTSPDAQQDTRSVSRVLNALGRANAPSG
ncbi:Golgi phosphoprotein 3 GPP34 [Glaciihabitans tibetensis]|uniref:Golgi phosphoprotein 3 GPP34 n=1 Tax=Glaciihabitans tibetensis TaxID=1266600 RepID=A0A2T0VFV1_9MICO|nr:GPP34 family phosphoprotein [Glaciihabitans tibetensis]PRY69097.1 Golgi phosphoprotein 3 GPP34 [Glaciihabitans tibetensis]